VAPGGLSAWHAERRHAAILARPALVLESTPPGRGRRLRWACQSTMFACSFHVVFRLLSLDRLKVQDYTRGSDPESKQLELSRTLQPHRVENEPRGELLRPLRLTLCLQANLETCCQCSLNGVNGQSHLISTHPSFAIIHPLLLLVKPVLSSYGLGGTVSGRRKGQKSSADCP
jgi:hypothetical protein